MVALSNDHSEDIPRATYEAVRKQLQRANQRIREQEQEIQQLKAEKWQRRELRKKKDFKPAEKDIIIEMDRQIDSPHAHKDEEGFTRFCYSTATINNSTSDSTPKRNVEAVLEQWTDFPIEVKKVDEYEDGKMIKDRLYIKKKFDTSLVQSAIEATLSEEKKRKQGGNKYLCQQCGSKDVKIKRRLHCNCCGHETDLEDSYPYGKLNNNTGRSNLLLEDESIDGPSDESDTGETGRSNLLLVNNESATAFFAESIQLDGVVLKPYTPPIALQVADDSPEIDPIITRTEAAKLLVSIAGDYPVHIGMNRKGESKYRTVKSCLTLEKGLEHFLGTENYGALCSRSDGRTRAFCWDTDSAKEWELFKEYASILTDMGCRVILEPSPAKNDDGSQRGGHMWIIFDGLVDAAIARSVIYARVPQLAEVKESWPAIEHGKGNRVRLPGGKYLRPGIDQWCELISVIDGENSRNGDQSAQLLLTHQTSASIVVSPDPTPEDSDHAESNSQIDQLGDNSPVEQKPIGLTDLDELWKRKYADQKLWFTFLPSYLIARFNEEHTPEDYLPKQRNGKALSPNGTERTPSTEIWTDQEGRERYTDFSQNGRRLDGSPDTGDSFDAYLKTNGKTIDQALYELGKATNARAKRELEAAARQGQPIPGWIEEIISDHGRDYYARIRPRLGDDPQQIEQEESTQGGVSGFQNVPATELFPAEQKQGAVHYTPCIVCGNPKSVKRADGVYVCGTDHNKGV